MVRIAIASVALVLGGCLAEDDVYYHTQLLQTKMNPQKVVVDVDGKTKTNRKDDVALFQSHMKRKARKSSHQKFMKALKGMKDLKGMKAKKQGDFGDPPPEAEEECAVYYGAGVDVQQCWDCSMENYMAVDEDAWMEDPNAAFRTLLDGIDGCMGATNALTEACEGEYGEEVALLECLMCGLECECESPEECDLECHRGCMEEDEEAWEEEMWEDEEMEEREEEGEDCQYEMCQAFYPPEPDNATCSDCGEQSMTAMMSVVPFSERAAFEEGMATMDECMGQTNAVTEVCQEHYGADVDVFECFMCGMSCGCDFEQCDEECHGDCMEEDWMDGVGETTFSSFVQKAKAWAVAAVHRNDTRGNMSSNMSNRSFFQRNHRRNHRRNDTLGNMSNMSNMSFFQRNDTKGNMSNMSNMSFDKSDFEWDDKSFDK